MKTISIIGGGVSGALILINILKYFPDAPLAVKWIEKSGEFGTGTAYSTDKDYHLLNVPANVMGLFHDYANDFFEWQLKKGFSYSEHDYIPRKIYGDYIRENLFNYLKKNTAISIELIQAECKDIHIDIDKESYSLLLHNNKIIYTDTVILATGNFLPAHPRLANMEFISHPGYYRDPWDNNIHQQLRRTDDVLIIGNGLTMVDKILDLYHQIHKGKIYSISRNGYLPFTHYPCSRHQKYPDYTNELLEASGSSIDLFSIIRKHIDIGIKSGIDWRVVVDTIRPSLPAIWDSLPLKEKRRFLRRLGSLWTVVRHRIPVICADIIHLLRDKKQLQILGGRIDAIRPVENGFIVTYTDKKTQSLRDIAVNKIINCTGPQITPDSTDSHLIKNLFSKGWLCKDELSIGFNVLPDGRLLDREHNIMPEFYTIGNGLKGVLFESTAIPEIRLQAYQLAKKITEEAYVETVK